MYVLKQKQDHINPVFKFFILTFLIPIFIKRLIL